ncbi:hypothetical protein RTG_00428 [Rhodotorula toruloides ATCC 204091]|nr:hypothetical protein RTG_00428 [Rhodotorula toruloides ATCC 204091]
MSYPTSSWRPHQADSYAYPPAQPPSYTSYAHSSSVPPAAAAAPQNPHPMSQHPSPPQQHYHSQSASPPRSFGGFGSSRSGGREMGSAVSLPPLDASGSFPYSQRGPYPPSPVSPSYPGGLAGQMSSSSSSYTTSGPSGGYYSSRPPPPSDSYMFSSCPPNVSMHPPPAPRTPPPSAGRKERVPSAQASFAHYQPVAATSNSGPPSGYGAPQSYATRPEEGNYQQQAPSEDLNKAKAKYNVCGVLLTEEEYRALADSPSLARRKSSLRTFAPAQSLDDMFAYGVNPSSTYEASQSAYLDFPIDLQRPASAPPTPAFEPEAVFQFATYGSSGNSPPRGSVPLNRRRGSSLDPSIPRSFGSSGLVGFAPSQEYSYAPPRPQTPPQQQQRRPSASMQGWSYPETPMSAPQRGYYAQPPPSSAYPSYPRHQLDPISPSPAPSSSRSAPTPSNPLKPSGGSRRARGGNKSISFINFSAADSKTLLNGVAPSGSSKKRQRDEDDGRREAKRMEFEARE